MYARPLRFRALWSLLVANWALTYFLWTPFDVPVRSLGDAGGVLAVGMAAIAFALFVPSLLALKGIGSEGKLLNLLVVWLIGSIAIALVAHGGVLGPSDYTGNFVFRALLVLAAAPLGHRLAATGFVTPRRAAVVGAGIILTIGLLMAVALAGGVVANTYGNQGVRAVGTASGDAVQAYLLAYAAPLVFFIRTSWLRSGLYLIALVAVLLTYRRGPFVCALVPMAILPFLDRRRASGRRWYIDVGLFAVGGVLVIAFLGVDRVFARWLGLFEGRLLSERDLIYPILLSRLLAFDVETVIGHGIGSSVVFLEAGLGRPIYAHNDWLELSVSLGVLGILPFIGLHALLARGAWRAWRSDRYVGLVSVALYLQFALSNWLEGVLYAAQHGAILMFFLGASIGWVPGRSDHR